MIDRKTPPPGHGSVPGQRYKHQPAKAAMPTSFRPCREAFTSVFPTGNCLDPVVDAPRMLAASTCWFLISDPAGNRPDLREAPGSSLHSVQAALRFAAIKGGPPTVRTIRRSWRHDVDLLGHQQRLLYQGRG